jgi:hypothetical protein
VRWRRLSWPPAGRLNLWVMSAAYVIFGLSQVFQAHRWQSTPAYHVLLQVFPAPAWGGLFLAAGAGLALAARFFARRLAVYAALMLAFALTAGWMLAFAVRYLTSSDTTPETWVSWAIFGYLLLKVAISVDGGDGPGTREFRQAVDDALTSAAGEHQAALQAAADAWSHRARSAVTAACDSYGQALRAGLPQPPPAPGDLAPALDALREARSAMARAEEAYARATGRSVPPGDAR